jgi:acyl dehydratase
MSAVKMTEQYLEDFAVGQVYRSGRLPVEKDQIIAFAAQFDPQPYHLDEQAARKSVFGGLVASGWHTAALTMRLIVDGEFRPANGVLGVGFDDLSWPHPVRPGDVLHAESEVIEVRPSRSRPDRGLIRVRTTTFERRGGTDFYRQSAGPAPASRRRPLIRLREAMREAICVPAALT